MPNIMRLGGGAVAHTNPYEQIINYLMLYDGSLGGSGPTGANVCAPTTGGWNFTRKDSGSVSVAYNSSNMVVTPTYNGEVRTTNAIDMTDFKCIYFKGYCAFYVCTASSATWNDYGNINCWWESTPYPENYLKKLLMDSEAVTTRLLYVYSKSASSWSARSLKSALLAKADNWSLLCSKAGVTAPATLAELLLSSANLTTILGNLDAVDYMVAQCTGEFMVDAVSSATFLTVLNTSTYKTSIQANVHWSKFLALVA